MHQWHYIFTAIIIRTVNRAIIDDNNDEIMRGSRYIRFTGRLQIKSGYRYRKRVSVMKYWLGNGIAASLQFIVASFVVVNPLASEDQRNTSSICIWNMNGNRGGPVDDTCSEYLTWRRIRMLNNNYNKLSSVSCLWRERVALHLH